MQNFYVIYVQTFSIALPMLAVAIGCFGAFRAQLRPAQIGMFIAVSSVVFGLWYATAMPLSQAGAFNVPAVLGEPPIVLMYLFGGASVVWALAWLTPLGRQLSEATPLSAIAAFQIPRLMGGLFVVGWLVGDLPALFALPAGLGDILAGIAGWQASRALAAGAPNAHRLLWRATVIGIADFILAVVLGILTSPGFAHFYAQDAPNIINDHPLAMFPAYFVPIFLGFHLIAIARLRRDRRQGTMARA